MMNDEVFIEEAKKRIERLNHQALLANEHFRAIYEVRKLYPEYKEVLNMASFFFQLSIYAHQTHVYLSITKAFCTDEKTDESGLILLGDMLKHAKEKYCNPFEVNEFKSTLSDETSVLRFNSLEDAFSILTAGKNEKAETIDKIRKQRNKYYAHMDMASSKDYTRFFEENEVKMDEIDELLNLNFTICNCINVLLNGPTLMHSVMHPGSLEVLAKYAEKGRQMDDGFLR